MTSSDTLCLAACLSLCAACTSSRAIELDVVMASGNCQQVKEGVSRVTLAEVATLRGTQLLGSESSESTHEGGAPFLVAIAGGEKPTAGHGLVYDDAKLDGRTLVIAVHETSPPGDAISAQVITHPCLVLELPEGDFDNVRVVTASGTTIGELTR